MSYRSYPATDKAGTGFILTITDTEEITAIVIVEEEVRKAAVLILTVVGTVAWLFMEKKASDIMSLISYEVNDINKLGDENIKVYLFFLKEIALTVGCIFIVSVMHSSRFGSSWQKIWESSEFHIYANGLGTNQEKTNIL